MKDQLTSSIGDALGKFMLGFSVWLEHEVMVSKPDRILFASREGWFIGKCWQILNNNKYLGKIHYIRTSRRVLRLSVINDLNDMEQLLLIPNNDCPLYFFINERFGVDLLSKKYSEDVQRAGFLSPHQIINRRNDMVKLKSLLPCIMEDHLTYVNTLRKLARDYYHFFGIQNGTSFLVDIGYNGTFNKCLTRLIPESKIMGKYIATFDGVADASKDKGWLYNQMNNRLKNNAITRNVPMLEYLMMSNSGGLIDFFEKNGSIEPRLKAAPSKEQFAIIQKIQNSALEYISRNADTVSTYKTKDTPNFVSSIFDFLDNPKLAEIKIFDNHFLEDDYGGNATRRFFPKELCGSRTVKQEFNLILQHAWSGATDVLIKQHWSCWQKLYRPLWIKFLILKRAKAIQSKSKQ